MTPAPAAVTASLTFVGTATTVLRLGSFTLLTDPNFLHRGQRAYLGRGLWSRRLTEPALGLTELPALDAVLLSHLHGDHFDRVARRGLDPTVPLVTTPHAARRLGRRGFAVRPLATWERWTATHRTPAGRQEELVVESLPAVHAFGVMGRVLPPVMGSLLELRVDGVAVRRLLVSGDTLVGDHLDAIRERHPDVDTAVLHLGGTRVLGRLVTMDGDQGVEFLGRVRPQRAVPVHHADYGVFRSPLGDFLAAADRAGWRDRVCVVPAGQTVAL